MMEKETHPDAVGSWAVTDYTEDLALDCNSDNASLGNNLRNFD